MIQHRITLVASLVLLCSLVGCTTAVRITPEKVRQNPERTFTIVVKPAEITGMVFKSDSTAKIDAQQKDSTRKHSETPAYEIVNLDAEGGFLNLNKQTISGTTKEGVSTEAVVDSLHLIRLKSTDLGSTFVPPGQMCDASLSALDNPLVPVKKGESPCWDAIEFRGGGRFVPSQGIIQGISRGGTSISFPLAEMRYAEYKRGNPRGTLTIGLAAVVAFFLLDGYSEIIDWRSL